MPSLLAFPFDQRDQMRRRAFLHSDTGEWPTGEKPRVWIKHELNYGRMSDPTSRACRERHIAQKRRKITVPRKKTLKEFFEYIFLQNNKHCFTNNPVRSIYQRFNLTKRVVCFKSIILLIIDIIHFQIVISEK